MSNDQEEFDLEKFADLFDTAMSSTNPTVQRAFKNLLLISSLVDATENAAPGPMRKLIEDVKKLNKKVSELEYSTNYNKTYATTTTENPWTPGTRIGSLFSETIIGTGSPYTATSTASAFSQSAFTMVDLKKLKTLYEESQSVDYDSILSKWEKKYD